MSLESKVTLHRIREVLKNLSGVFTFLVAELGRERGLRDHEFGAQEAILDLDEHSDIEDRPKGEESKHANAENASELSAEAEVPLGTDERGFGKETFLGRVDALDEEGNVVTGKGAVWVSKKGLHGPQPSRPNYGGLARRNRRLKL